MLHIYNTFIIIIFYPPFVDQMIIDLNASYLYVVLHGYPYPPYYDCSNKTTLEWYETGERAVLLGPYFFISGIILTFLYILCLIAMVKNDLLKTSCYKIMFALGILDIFNVFANSIMTGYFGMIGAVFCTHPVTLLSIGAFACGTWCATSATCILLASNRCAELSDNFAVKSIFKGKKLCFLFGLISLYFLFIMFFTVPPSFNSNWVSWFFNPMIGLDPSYYVNIFHSINNMAVSSITTCLYLYLCVKVYVKSARGQKMGRFQKQVFIQSVYICSVNVVAASIYVYMQYTVPSQWYVLVGQVAWQLSAGSVSILYLILNHTIRRGVLSLLIPKEWADAMGITFSPTTVNPSGTKSKANESSVIA